MSATAPAATLPTYEALRSAQQGVRLTDAALRLLWTLQGPLSTSVMVMAERQNPDSPREAYFQQTLGGTSWHAIASEALTEPQVSSITVTVDVLQIWADEWEESHRHAEPGDEGCIFGQVTQGQEVEGERDEDADADDGEDGLVLLRCCGTNRPSMHTPLVVRPPSSSGRQHITVHDYVSAVHPWLMAQWDDILSARNVWGDRPPSADTKLAVNYHGPGHLMIDELEHWLSLMRGVRHIPQVYSAPPPHLRPDPPLVWGPNPTLG